MTPLSFIYEFWLYICLFYLCGELTLLLIYKTLPFVSLETFFKLMSLLSDINIGTLLSFSYYMHGIFFRLFYFQPKYVFRYKKSLYSQHIVGSFFLYPFCQTVLLSLRSLIHLHEIITVRKKA